MSEHATNAGKTFPWHEVYSADTAATAKFYTEALGWGTETMEMPGGAYTVLTNNGMPVGGLLDLKETQGAPPHWAVYIAVDDLDARMAKCQELGATVVHGPMQIESVGKMVLIQDPTGAVVWLFQPQPKG